MKHEKEFWSFEGKGRISTPREFLLQIHRTTSRELAKSRHNVAIIEEKIASFDRMVEDRVRSLFDKQWGAMIVEFPTIAEDLKIETPIEHPLRNHLAVVKSLTEALEKFSVEELAPMLGLETLTYEIIDSNIFASTLDFQSALPIALSGISEQRFTVDSGSESTGFHFLSVLPGDNVTQIILHAPKRFAELAKESIRMFTDPNSSQSFLDYIEAFALVQTDHWFLNPDVAKKDGMQADIERILNLHLVKITRAQLLGFCRPC